MTKSPMLFKAPRRKSYCEYKNTCELIQFLVRAHARVTFDGIGAMKIQANAREFLLPQIYWQSPTLDTRSIDTRNLFHDESRIVKINTHLDSRDGRSRQQRHLCWKICFIIAATRVCVRKIFVGIVKIDRTTRRRVVGFDLNTFLFNRVKWINCR